MPGQFIIITFTHHPPYIITLQMAQHIYASTTLAKMSASRSNTSDSSEASLPKLTVVPPYEGKTTISPCFSVTFSFSVPGPTASTSPRFSDSCAFSGIRMPAAVFYQMSWEKFAQRMNSYLDGLYLADQHTVQEGNNPLGGLARRLIRGQAGCIIIGCKTYHGSV